MAVPTGQEIRLPLLTYAAESEYRFGNMVKALETTFHLRKRKEKNSLMQEKQGFSMIDAVTPRMTLGRQVYWNRANLITAKLQFVELRS